MACIHEISLKLNPILENLISQKKLICNDKKFCDHLIPLTTSQINRQDISCVTKDSPNCPLNKKKS